MKCGAVVRLVLGIHGVGIPYRKFEKVRRWPIAVKDNGQFSYRSRELFACLPISSSCGPWKCYNPKYIKSSCTGCKLPVSIQRSMRLGNMSVARPMGLNIASSMVLIDTARKRDAIELYMTCGLDKHRVSPGN
jgi:hypothetical protein